MSPRAKVPNPLTETMRFRCTPVDKKLIEERAIAVGVTVTEYLRARTTGRMPWLDTGPGSLGDTPPSTDLMVGGETSRVTTAGEVVRALAEQGVPEEVAVSAPTVEELEVADEVAEAQLDDPTARQAFITRRTVQLRGQGKTTPVARRAAEEEWANR